MWPGFGKTAREDDGPIDRLRRAAWELAQWRDFTARVDAHPFDRDADIDRLVAELHAFAALTDKPSYNRDNLYLDTAPARHLSQEIALQQAFGHEDYDGWEARLVDLSRDRNFSKARHGRGPGYKQGVARRVVIDAIEQLRAHLDQFRHGGRRRSRRGAAAGADAARRALRGAEGARRRARLPRPAAQGARPRQERCRRSAAASRRASRTSSSTSSRTPIRSRPRSCCCSRPPIPSQTDWRAVTPVPGRLFIVGDPKQSIYRFRRADVGIYRDVCERLEGCGARLVKLTTSFRSVPGIQACVNAAFAPVMTGDAFTLQADYVPLSPFRADTKGQPAVVALPVPEPYGSAQHLGDGDRGVAARRGRRVHRLAGQRERVEGDRADRRQAGAASRRGTSASCSAASSASATT